MYDKGYSTMYAHSAEDATSMLLCDSEFIHSWRHTGLSPSQDTV